MRILVRTKYNKLKVPVCKLAQTKRVAHNLSPILHPNCTVFVQLAAVFYLFSLQYLPRMFT